MHAPIHNTQGKTMITVTHNREAQRFEATVDGLLCVADYRLREGAICMTHTYVPQALQGRGIAAQLVKAALAYAKQQQLKVEPVCSYVRAYMRRHAGNAELKI